MYVRRLKVLRAACVFVTHGARRCFVRRAYVLRSALVDASYGVRKSGALPGLLPSRRSPCNRLRNNNCKLI